MYGRSDVNVKVERGSTFTFTRGFSYIVSILFTHVKPVKVYVSTPVKITRQWKSTFRSLLKEFQPPDLLDTQNEKRDLVITKMTRILLLHMRNQNRCLFVLI